MKRALIAIASVGVFARHVRRAAPHECGVIRNVCCDVSALRGAVFKLSPVSLPPPKPAIACTS